jgi:hypothetical protein
MPALSHSALVSGWPKRSAALGLGVVLADSDADPQTLVLSFHLRPAVSQSMRVKGCVEMGSACAWLATAMPTIATIRAENFTSSPREGLAISNATDRRLFQYRFVTLMGTSTR